MVTKKKYLNPIGKLTNYFVALDTAFSIIPDAKITPIATMQIPRNFNDVISSFKKINPPTNAKMGVNAPNAAVWAGPNCRIAKLYNSIASIAISKP